MKRRGRLTVRWGIVLALVVATAGLWLSGNRVRRESQIERVRQRLARGPRIGALRTEMAKYLRQQQVDFRYVDARAGEAEFDSEVDAAGVPISEIGGVIQAIQPFDLNNKESGAVILSTLVFDRNDRLRTYRVTGFHAGP